MSIEPTTRRAVLLALALTVFATAKSPTYDVVVYGGTAGGVISAIAAAREGASVVLLEPSRHLGGMLTGGLGRTDHGRREYVGGYSLELYQRLGRAYGKDIVWYPEPHVAEQVIDDWLAETGVTVVRNARLSENSGVSKDDGRLTEIRLENGDAYRGRIFIDAGYEGDLLAQAGVAHTWGRESAAQYGESLAGVRPKDRNHQFDFQISARNADAYLLPEIQSRPRGEIGAADHRIQAYNFRLCLTDDPANQVPIPKPAGYDPARYELLARLIQAKNQHEDRPLRMRDFMIVSRLENQAKTDINNYGAFSTDYIGKNYDYPTASYARRAEIRQDHVNYTQGFFHFLQTDARVPKPLQTELRRWGLAADEFADTDHWPRQLYVREARRMIGSYVMKQKDIQDDIRKTDSIGMGTYNSDSHNVQRFVQPDGTVQNEGNMEVRVKPYEIPYRILTPQRAQASNLLVPVCVSAGHVAYSTVRMEPVYMIMGQAAGVAAALAAKDGRPVQDVDMRILRRKLLQQGAVLETPPLRESNK